MERLFESAPSIALVGVQPLEIAGGRCRMRLVVKPSFMNVIGTLHAGFTTFLADTCMFGAAWSSLQEGESITTLEIKINLLKSVKTGTLEANATLLKRGRTVILASADVRDEKGALVAHAVSTLLIIRGENKEGPKQVT
ncbi:MAG: PaaI family thioesterase [Nitrososphaerota archaeon]|jgi:uncharacterized protein (TIGR00369 family)|nr:PaaI family thioesterase [Nitrososphaerota archaeon]